MGFTTWTPTQHISLITFLCNEYEEAMSFYAGILNFTIHKDERVDPDSPTNHSRFIVLMPPKLTQLAPLAGLRVTRAESSRQRRAVGNQAGDSVFLTFEVDNFEEMYGKLKSCGVRFHGDKPRQEKYGKAIVFEDVYGNLIDLIDRPVQRTGSLFAGDK